MRPACIILLAVAFAFGQTAPRGVIAGTVSDASSNEPIRKAIVTLTLVGTPRTWAKERTDSSGQFRFEGLPAGKYDLRANKAELGTAVYGANSTRETGESIILAAGEARSGLKLRFIRSASIGGRVFDSDGDPVPGAVVSLMRATRTLGERALVNYRGANTDDRGEYRITGVDQGQYYLLATPVNRLLQGIPPNPANVPTTVLAPSYYGGAREASEAAPVNVRAGERVESLDFHLHTEEAHPIRGRVTGVPDTGAAPGPPPSQSGVAGMITVLLVPATNEMGRGSNGRGIAPPDYQFDFGAVPPGRYNLEATVRSGGKTWAAWQVIDSSRPVPEIVLALAPSVDVGGELRVEGKAPPMPRPFAVTLTRDSGRSANLSAAPGTDGRFTIQQVPPGEWVVNVNPVPQGGYLKSARYGDNDVRFTRITIGQGPPEALNIVISMNTAKIDGLVDAAAPADAKRAGIVLAPTGKLHTLARFYYGTVADEDGRFHMEGIAPGTYKIFALEKLAPPDFRTPEAADQLDALGAEIDIGEGAAVEAHPKLIPMERARQALPEARQ